MKKISAVLAVVVSVAVWCPAADTPKNPDGDAAAKLQAMQQRTADVKQFELAVLIVELAQLQRFLPPNPSPGDYFQLLMANGIAPAAGWQADAAVSRYDLARVVVLTMKQGSKVEHPNDPQAWIDYCVQQGIRIDTIGLATKPLQPLQFPVGPSMYYARDRSSQKQPAVVPTGELQLGALLLPIRTYFSPSTPTASSKGARI